MMASLGDLITLHRKEVHCEQPAENSFETLMTSLASELINGLPYSSFLVNSRHPITLEDCISHYRILPLRSTAPSQRVLHFLIILEVAQGIKKSSSDAEQRKRSAKLKESAANEGDKDESKN